MESASGIWNGDVDLGNGQLQLLRSEYDSRVNLATVNSTTGNRNRLEIELLKLADSLDEDIPFLDEGFKQAVEDYRKKFDNRTTPEENLKNATWNVVEFQTLLQQAQLLKGSYEEQLSYLDPPVFEPRHIQAIRTVLKRLGKEMKCYLRNLYKKKITAATHILVLMLSDERRNQKPYALRVRYVPYRSLRDQYVRDLTKDIKRAMVERGLRLVGQYIYI